MITRNKLEDIVKEGLVHDIFKMEQSYELIKTIGDNTKELNGGSLSNYNELFGTIQYSFQTEALLAAARIYDNPSKIYPTRCLQGVLQYLSDNALDLPSIREPFQLARHLKFMNAPDQLIKDASSESVNFAYNFSYYINGLLKDPERIVTLEKLKLFRDKVLAHNEKVDSKIIGPTWGSLKDLISISKNVVGVLGWSYFSMAYVIDGRYVLSEDTLDTSMALKQVFKILQNEGT